MSPIEIIEDLLSKSAPQEAIAAEWIKLPDEVKTRIFFERDLTDEERRLRDLIYRRLTPEMTPQLPSSSSP